MLTTVEGVYRDGRVELSERPAVALNDSRVLVTFLPASAPERTPRPLRGVWKGKFPDDFDVDEALKEIRGAWQEEARA